MPEGCAKLKLVGPLNLRTATETCEALRQALAHHVAVLIDCTAATEIDLSFIQLLVATRSSAQQAGQTVSLAERPDGPLLAVLSRAGLLQLGSQPFDLQAKLFGGAAVLPYAGYSVGLRNVTFAMKRLSRDGIPVTAQRTGGTLGQQIKFNTRTGDVFFRHPQPSDVTR